MSDIKVLIADDIYANQFLLSSIVEEMGYKVLTVSNGKEAIETLTKERFDILLLDIEMPVMNGIETARYLRNSISDELRNLPIIALTAHNPEDFESELSGVGFNELLLKPYSYDKISKVISKYILK